MTVVGTGFKSGTTKCQFGALSPTSALYISQTQIVCFSPAGTAGSSGSVALEVTVDNSGSAETFSNDGVLFTYQQAQSVSVLQPSAGPQMGGTRVTLIGSGFENDADSSCRFATQAAMGSFTQVEYITFSNVVCQTPESDAIGLIDVEIANNGLDFSANGVKFLFRAAESVSMLAPSEGPTTGGIMVTLSGSNFVFSPDLVCLFGSVVAPANYVSGTSISCVAPAGVTGTTVVEASNNKIDFTSDGQVFEYYQSMMVSRVMPLFASVLGGATVTLSGPAFTARRTTPACRFGKDVTTAAYSGTTVARRRS